MRFIVLSSLLLAASAQYTDCLDDSADILPDNLAFVPSADRKNLTYSLAGEQIYNGPIIDLDPQWASGALIHNIARIFLTEILGYTYTAPHVIWYTHEMVFAPTGCSNWQVMEECAVWDEHRPASHYGLEGWGTAQKAMTLTPPDRRATELPRHQYVGVEALYIPGDSRDSALLDDMVLSSHEGWNATRFPNLINHFELIDVAVPKINAATSAGAIKVGLSISNRATTEEYRTNTGDSGANCYDFATNALSADEQADCMGDWWVTPACRADPTKCIPAITCASWGEDEFRQWAVYYEMPIAIADFSWGDYVKAPKAANVAFYWWYPDATFGSLRPQRVSMPPWNVNEHASAIFKTSMPDTQLTRFVWKHMKDTGNGRGQNIVTVLERMMLFEADLTGMLESMASRGETAKTLACEFVQENVLRWAAWIPELRMCGHGEGWDFDTTECISCPAGTVSGLNADATFLVCIVCEPGTYCPAGVTAPLPCKTGHECPRDGMASADVCQPGYEQEATGGVNCDLCAAGSYSDSNGQIKCSACPAGYFSEYTGSDEVQLLTECTRCRASFFQDTEGSTDCIPCKPGFQSPPGSSLSTDCVCQKNKYYSAAEDTCNECGQGSVCLEGRDIPFVEEGYYGEPKFTEFKSIYVRDQNAAGEWEWSLSTNADDVAADDVRRDADGAMKSLFDEPAVWVCPFGVLACAGKKVKTSDGTFSHPNARYADLSAQAGCSKGGLLTLNGCSRCMDGYYFSADDVECLPCGGGDSALYPILYIGGLCIMFMLYKVTRYHASQKLTNMLMFSCSASLLINFFQMLGVIGFYAVDFPFVLQGFFDFFKLFVFDLDVLRASCATGADFQSRFLTRTLSPIIFMFSFLALYPVSAIIGKATGKEPMDRHNVVNTAGLITNAGYIALCKISMQYYECKIQPAANPVVAAYPDIDCNSSQHNALKPLAVLMTIIYGAGIYLVCLYLCWIAPILMVQSQSFRRKTRFLVGRWNPGRWYWGPVLQTRNLVVSLVAVAYPSDGIMQLVTTGAIVCIYTAAQSSMEPWRDLFLNVTDTVLGLAITLTCMFGVLLVKEVGNAEERHVNATGYLTFIFAISFMALGYAAGKAMYAFVRPLQAKAKDRRYTEQATKVLLLQTKRLYQLCMSGTDEEDLAEAISTYMTVAEQKQIFKVGKVLLHEMCGVSYKSDIGFKRLMINKVEEETFDIENVELSILDNIDLAGEGTKEGMKKGRVSALSRLGGH